MSKPRLQCGEIPIRSPFRPLGNRYQCRPFLLAKTSDRDPAIFACAVIGSMRSGGLVRGSIAKAVPCAAVREIIQDCCGGQKNPAFALRRVDPLSFARA